MGPSPSVSSFPTRKWVMALFSAAVGTRRIVCVKSLRTWLGASRVGQVPWRTAVSDADLTWRPPWSRLSPVLPLPRSAPLSSCRWAVQTRPAPSVLLLLVPGACSLSPGVGNPALLPRVAVSGGLRQHLCLHTGVCVCVTAA